MVASHNIQQQFVVFAELCTDHPPDGNYTCKQQKEFGKCEADFIKKFDFCRRTCSRCRGDPHRHQMLSNSRCYFWHQTVRMGGPLLARWQRSPSLTHKILKDEQSLWPPAHFLRASIDV